MAHKLHAFVCHPDPRTFFFVILNPARVKDLTQPKNLSRLLVVLA